MAQLEARKFSDASKTPAAQNSPAFKTPKTISSPAFRTPKVQNSPTFKTPKTLNSPTSQHHQEVLAGDATIWPSSPFARQPDLEGLQQSPLRKSVLSRVKEKAKKWRHTLSIKRRQNQETNSPSCAVTPAWGVNLNEHEDEVEENPEYLGAPMYESEKAAENYKETAKQHPREVQVPSEKHVVESSVKNDTNNEETTANTSNKTITETVTEKLAPAYAAVSDATHSIASRISGLTVETPATADTENSGGLNVVGPQQPEAGKESNNASDKGVSVKEYLLKKFEPGEDEKALSQVITEKISPKTSPGGMVGKMKEAVSAFLRNEDQSSNTPAKPDIPPINIPNSTHDNLPSDKVSNKKDSSPRDHGSNDNSKTSTQNNISPKTKTNSSSSHNTSLPTKSKSTSHVDASSVIKNAQASSVAPISFSARVVTENENSGRILQTN